MSKRIKFDGELLPIESNEDNIDSDMKEFLVKTTLAQNYVKRFISNNETLFKLKRELPNATGEKYTSKEYI